jgi:hypothetical protein
MRRAFCAALAAVSLAACQIVAPPSAPAPEAAAHGAYRAKTPQGVDLVFDARRALYAVPSAPGTFWLDQRYFRRAATGWESGPALEGPWRECAPSDLPEGLRYPDP